MIGAILMAIGPLVGVFTGIIGLVGLILVVVAFRGLANFYKDQSISTNVIFGVLMIVVGVVIAGIIVVFAAFGILAVLGFDLSNWASWTMLSTFNWQAFTNWGALIPYAVAILGALIVLVAFIIVAAIFLRRSLDSVAEKSGVHMFATTGLLTLIGACMTVIIIGFVLLWVSLILLAVAFSRLKA
jgi:uncharacterized membrane protein